MEYASTKAAAHTRTLTQPHMFLSIYCVYIWIWSEFHTSRCMAASLVNWWYFFIRSTFFFNCINFGSFPLAKIYYKKHKLLTWQNVAECLRFLIRFPLVQRPSPNQIMNVQICRMWSFSPIWLPWEQLIQDEQVKWNQDWYETAARNKRQTVLPRTCKVPDLEHNFLGCCYFGTSESICQNISHKCTV